jgi:hypothetical protein
MRPPLPFALRRLAPMASLALGCALALPVAVQARLGQPQPQQPQVRVLLWQGGTVQLRAAAAASGCAWRPASCRW